MKIINIADNYRPNLIILGHNNILEYETRTKLNPSIIKK